MEKESSISLLKLFRICFIISMCTFGGGLVVISVLQKKFVEELGLIEQNEMMDMCAIAQSCPGVMSVNVSIIIGYRVGGVLGAATAALGTIMPPMIILSILSVCYVQFRSNTVIALILKGMQSGVAAVLMHMTVKLSRPLLKKELLFDSVVLVLAAISIIFLKIDIILVILCCGITGAVQSICSAKHKEVQ